MKLKDVAFVLSVALAISLALVTFQLWGRWSTDVGTLGSGVDIVGIDAEGCEQCQKAQPIVDALAEAGTFEVTSQKVVTHSSAEGKKLIQRYGIKRLPALVMIGDTSAIPDHPSLRRDGDALIVTSLPPPYYDLENSTVGGIVGVTYIVAPDCKQCNNITRLTDELSGFGVVFGEVEAVAFDSAKGKQLVKQYNITSVPTALFSEEAGAYEIFVQAWPAAGTVDDGVYVLRAPQPPFKELPSGKVRGLLDVTFIGDESCDDCYDVEMHRTVLASNFGVKATSEKTVDIASAEGKALRAKYAITVVPTFIVTGDTDVYAAFKQAWTQVGTTEKDGVLVFRKPDVLGLTYKDLATGKVVEGKAAEPTVVIEDDEATGAVVAAPAEEEAAPDDAAAEAAAQQAVEEASESDLGDTLAAGLQ